MTGNRRFVLVAVDYFTKWAEVEALASIRDVDVKKFVWKNIVTRFGATESSKEHARHECQETSPYLGRAL